MATFSNQATLSYQDNVINSNIVTGELLEVLSVTKTAVRESYGTNDDITYVVSIVNSGTAPFSGLTVTDDLGAYQFVATAGETTLVPLEYVEGSVRYYINGVLQGAPVVTAGESLVIGGISVPAGGNAIVVYEARTNAFAPPADGSVVNTVSVSGGGLSEAITAQETVTPEEGLNLSITKAISPSVVSENGQLTYTFVIQNTGNTASVAEDNIIVSDTFSPVLDPITVTLDGNVLSAEDYNYVITSGEFSTAAGVISVPAATYAQNAETGVWEITPGVAVLEVTGTV